MNDEWILAFTKAVHIARGMGLPIQAAEDVAGEIVLRFVEQGGIEWINRFTVIDELRRMVGRTESRNAPLRRSLMLPGVEPEEDKRGTERTQVDELVDYELIERTRGELRAGERVVLEMMAQGLTPGEIAKRLGVSKGRISQRVSRIRMNARLERAGGIID